MRSADLKVPVGTSTQLGIGLTVAGVATAIVAFATGDRTEQTIGTLSGAAVAILAFAITAAIRAVQAKALIVAHAPLVGQQTGKSEPLEDVAAAISKEVGKRLDELIGVQSWTAVPAVVETTVTLTGAPDDMDGEPTETTAHGDDEGEAPGIPADESTPDVETRDLHEVV